MVVITISNWKKKLVLFLVLAVFLVSLGMSINWYLNPLDNPAVAPSDKKLQEDVLTQPLKVQGQPTTETIQLLQPGTISSEIFAFSKRGKSLCGNYLREFPLRRHLCGQDCNHFEYLLVEKGFPNTLKLPRDISRLNKYLKKRRSGNWRRLP